MTTLTAGELLRAIVQQYLASGDYNGLPAYVATVTLSASTEDVTAALIDLISEGSASVIFGDRHPNPHIRAFEDEPISDQLEKLRNLSGDYFVMYPTATVLAEAVDRSQYMARPYSLVLALGSPQLDFASFDPIVLDTYRRDPRYQFRSDDIQGSLSVGDKAYESEAFPEKHKVLLQSFAFSFNDQLERAVAVFYTDLDRLSPEHQQIWAAHELSGDFHMHPDAYRALVIGDWNLKVSLGDALVEEIRIINRMCELIGWPPLFKQVFQRPKELAFLLRPTRRELNDFILLLDKMLSDNINAKFFPSRIPRTTDTTRTDGKVVVQQRGTIALLEEWLNTAVRVPDPGPKNELLSKLREIRKLRQKPAHAIDDDTYDPALFKEQRRLFLNAYDVVRTMRLLLSNHPKAKPALSEMNEQVRVGEIWSI
jgi:hypothetical protein